MFLLLCALCLLAMASDAALPPEWKTCRKNSPDFNECIRKDIMRALKALKKGNDDMGIAPLDPYFIRHISMEIVPGFQLVLENTTTHGLSNLIIDKVELKNWEEMKAWLHVAQMSHHFAYRAIGKLGPLNLNSSGDARVVTKGVKMQLRMTFSEYTQHHKTHLEVDDIEVDIQPEDVQSFFEPHDREKIFASTINQVFENNWKSLWLSSKNYSSRLFSHVIRHIVDHVFENIPKDEIDFELVRSS